MTISCYIAFFRRQEITHDEIPFLSGEKEQADHERDSTGGDSRFIKKSPTYSNVVEGYVKRSTGSVMEPYGSLIGWDSTNRRIALLLEHLLVGQSLKRKYL